ncbi:uncharacterized protein LOC144645475 [Oculina patagonica]
MAPRAELWVNVSNQVKVMSTNTAAGQEGRRVAPDENAIYGAKSAKDIDLLTKAKAIRPLKCRACRNLSGLTLKELKSKNTSNMAGTRSCWWIQTGEFPKREENRSKDSSILKATQNFTSAMRQPIAAVNIAGSEIKTSVNARNLGVTLDQCLTMSTHCCN